MCRYKLANMALIAAFAVVTGNTLGDTSTPLSFVQRDARLVRSAFAKVNVGVSATLDAEGYAEVVAAGKAAKSREIMKSFATRLCETDGLKITDNTSFGEFIKYFDGSCSTQDFSALAMGLHQAVQKPAACGGAWLKEDDGDYGDNDHTNVDNDQANMDNFEDEAPDEPLSLLSTKVSVQSTLRMRAKATMVLRMVANARNRGRAFASAFTSLNATEIEEAAKEVRAAAEIAHFELNEAGYQELAKLKDNAKMAAYIRNVLKKEGLKVHDKKQVKGMAPWYTSECGPQTYLALTDELHRIAKSLDEKSSGVNDTTVDTCGGWVDSV